MKYEELLTMHKTKFDNLNLHKDLKESIYCAVTQILKAIEYLSIEEQKSLALVNTSIYLYLSIDCMHEYKLYSNTSSFNFQIIDSSECIKYLNDILITRYSTSPSKLIIYFNKPFVEINFNDSSNLEQLVKFISMFWKDVKLEEKSILINIHEIISKEN